MNTTDRRHETGHSRTTTAVMEARYWLTPKGYDALERLEHADELPRTWVPDVVDLLARRPDLAGIGFADVGHEVKA